MLIIIGLPFGIRAYDRYLEPKELTPGSAAKPVIKVSRGDQVVLKLRSADVTHGFNLKAYGIYIAKGIQPGKTIFVSFKADKAGIFKFMCNVFCGDIHTEMEGKLIVRDERTVPNA